jgi:hypothetical protein
MSKEENYIGIPDEIVVEYKEVKKKKGKKKKRGRRATPASKAASGESKLEVGFQFYNVHWEGTSHDQNTIEPASKIARVGGGALVRTWLANRDSETFEVTQDALATGRFAKQPAGHKDHGFAMDMYVIGRGGVPVGILSKRTSWPLKPLTAPGREKSTSKAKKKKSGKLSDNSNTAVDILTAMKTAVVADSETNLKADVMTVVKSTALTAREDDPAKAKGGRAIVNGKLEARAEEKSKNTEAGTKKTKNLNLNKAKTKNLNLNKAPMGSKLAVKLKNTNVGSKNSKARSRNTTKPTNKSKAKADIVGKSPATECDPQAAKSEFDFVPLHSDGSDHDYRDDSESGSDSAESGGSWQRLLKYSGRHSSSPAAQLQDEVASPPRPRRIGALTLNSHQRKSSEAETNRSVGRGSESSSSFASSASTNSNESASLEPEDSEQLHWHSGTTSSSSTSFQIAGGLHRDFGASVLLQVRPPASSGSCSKQTPPGKASLSAGGKKDSTGNKRKLKQGSLQFSPHPKSESSTGSKRPKLKMTQTSIRGFQVRMDKNLKSGAKYVTPTRSRATAADHRRLHSSIGEHMIQHFLLCFPPPPPPSPQLPVCAFSPGPM